jgi:cytidylate kinase
MMRPGWLNWPADLPATFTGGRILLADDDVTDAIRSEEISLGASKVAALPAVRAALLARQRAYRRFPGLVADGRDMASVVFLPPWPRCFLRLRPGRVQKDAINS